MGRSKRDWSGWEPDKTKFPNNKNHTFIIVTAHSKNPEN